MDASTQARVVTKGKRADSGNRRGAPTGAARAGGCHSRIPAGLPKLAPSAFFVIAVILTSSAWGQQTPYTPERGVEARRELVGAERPARPTEPPTRPPEAPAEPRRAPAERRPPRAGQVIAGRGARPSITGGKAAFEPIKVHPIVYGKIADEGKRIVKLDAPDLPVKEFLQRIALTTGWTIMVTQNVQGNVTAWLSNISASDALKVLELNGFYYEKDGNVLYVMTHDEYYSREYGALVKEELVVKHAKLGDIRTVLTGLQSKEGMVIADPRTGKIVVLDTKDNIKYMKEVLESLDIELEPTSFQLKYAQAEDLLDDLEPIVSETAIIQADPRTNQIVVTDIPECIEKVKAVIAKLDVDTVTETFQIKFAEPDDISGLLEAVLPETALITVDERTRQITVTTVPEPLEQARQLVQVWDRKLEQVAIEAYIMTANTARIRELGINWAYFDETADLVAAGYEAGKLDFTIGSLLIGRTPIDSSHLSAVIDLLAQDNDTEILANPRVVVSDNETATFQRVTEEPYQEGGYGGGGYQEPGGAYRSYIVPMRVQFAKWGTTLDVTPRVNDDNTIEMEISAEDSSAELRDIQSGTGYVTTVPVKTQNRVDTKVLVRNGETIVIGGLRVDSASKDVDKVPFLGDIPIVGNLFKSTTRRAADKELLIFLRLEIIEEADVSQEAMLSEFEEGLKEQVRAATRRPFDLGGDHRPFFQRDSVKKKGKVLPFVPRHGTGRAGPDRSNEAAADDTIGEEGKKE